MTTTAKAIQKTIKVNNVSANGSIDSYSNKTKEQLIQEIEKLKGKIVYYEELSDQKELRRRDCVNQLKVLLNGNNK